MKSIFTPLFLGRRCLLTAVKPGKEGSTPMDKVRDLLKVHVGSSDSWSGSRDAAVAALPLPQSQSELPSRKMMDSYCQAIIPLASNLSLRGKYINMKNNVRFGRILEDLDTMAVWIGYTHNVNPEAGKDAKSPLSIVTAAVDRIDIKKEALSAEKDVVIRGHVTWCGATSMEVTMNVEQLHNDVMRKIVEAKFLMVARDPQNRGKAYINPLTVETDAEKELFNDGISNKKKREQEMGQSLLRVAPNENERLLIHDIWMETVDPKASTFKRAIKPDNAIWMEDAILKNVSISFPEKRNLYNKIFGGYLMRQALELAWANALVYCKGKQISVLAVDDILFKRPVEIGSLLYLSSQVVYTESSFVQLTVSAEVCDPESEVRHITNIFHFTMESSDAVPKVTPRSYADFLKYLDGKRHFEEANRYQG